MSHPYTPPSANIERQGTADGAALAAFPRVGTFLVLVLGTITLGIYYMVWIYTRTQILNRLTKNPISMGLVGGYIACNVGNIALSIMSMAAAGSDAGAAMSGLSSLFALGAFVTALIWVFTFRARLHEVAKIQPGDGYWANGFLTFLFNVLYMNYKINQYQDRAGR